MSSARRRAPWIAAAVVLAGALAFTPIAPRTGEPGSRSLAMRLFGPIAALAASAQWVRADLAFRAGRIELFLARAESALAMEPASAAGWRYLAWHQAFHLASPEREPDPARRLAWVRAGLATAAEGERRCSEPSEMAMLAGLILVKVATLDPELPWPGGPVELWAGAAGHFERAAALGYDRENAESMRAAAEKAEKLERGER